MRFKYIIWDFDGTLFDTYPSMSTAFYQTLTNYGIKSTADEVMALMKTSMKKTIDFYTKKYNLGDRFIIDFEKLRDDLEEDGIKPFDHIKDICKNVCDSGGSNYVFTHRGLSALYFLDKFDMSKYFAECITSDNKFPLKPAPNAILFLMKKYGMRPAETIMIGDRKLDIWSAKSAGISACFFSDDNKFNVSADYNISDFSSLYRIIGLNRK